MSLLAEAPNRKGGAIDPGESATHMHGVILVEFGDLFDFAHVDDDGRDAAEERIPGALVCLPSIDEVGDALLEDFAINLDVRHCD